MLDYLPYYALNCCATITGAICKDSKPNPFMAAPIIISRCGGGKRQVPPPLPKVPRQTRGHRSSVSGPGPLQPTPWFWTGLVAGSLAGGGRAQVAQHVDQYALSRPGLSTGAYIRLAAINRACEPVSKQAMWDWVSQTALPRVCPKLRQRN